MIRIFRHGQMRIQYASDLHLERLRQLPRFGGLTPVRADVLVLAGDIHRGIAGVDTFAAWPCPVVYVFGNHEFHGARVDRVLADAKRRAVGSSVSVLANDVLVLGTVRFLGCTLWTDFRLNRNHTKSMAAAASAPDHRCIFTSTGQVFSPACALDEHKTSIGWLENWLRQPFEGTTVVVTHHAPHRLSLDDRFAAMPSAASFASDLSRLAGRSDVWIHGHVHRTSDYRLWGSRVLCNPRGRPSISEAGIVTGNNPQFNAALVCEVRTSAHRQTPDAPAAIMQNAPLSQL
jgi:predicted phosphodiesterase